MSNTQNAFLIPPPAPQQTHQRTPFGNAHDAAGNDGRDNEPTPFLTMLNQAADSQPSPALDLRLSVERGGQGVEEHRASLPLGGGEMLFSEAVLDLLASLRGNLEKEGVDVGHALESRFGPDWSLRAAEIVLSKLSSKYAAILENDSPLSINIKALVSDRLKFSLEASLAGSGAAEEIHAETQQLENSPQMNGNVLSQVIDGQLNGTNEETAAARSQEQPWTVSEIAARGANLVDKHASVEGQALIENSDVRLKDELSAGSRGEQGGKKGRDQQENRDASARLELGKAANLDDNADKPRASTNFTEHKTAFEQFFEQATARSDSAGAAPKLELTKDSQLSQGAMLRDGLDNMVRFIRMNGEQRASLIIDPPALGRLSVELVSSTAGLEASIKVSSEQVRQLIQDHLVQLRHSLEQQGVHLTHFSVDVRQDDARRNQDERETHQRRGVRGVNEDDAIGEEALFQVDLNQGLMYWIA